MSKPKPWTYILERNGKIVDEKELYLWPLKHIMHQGEVYSLTMSDCPSYENNSHGKCIYTLLSLNTWEQLTEISYTKIKEKGYRDLINTLTKQANCLHLNYKVKDKKCPDCKWALHK